MNGWVKELIIGYYLIFDVLGIHVLDVGTILFPLFFLQQLSPPACFVLDTRLTCVAQNGGAATLSSVIPVQASS